MFVKPAAGWVNADESTRLQASDGVANDGLGRSVAISGDTVVLGAAGHQVATSQNQGAAYLYLKPDTGWGTDGAIADQNTELTTTDGAANDQFGSPVATTGAIVAASAPGHQVGLMRRGAAYVFVKPLFGWPLATTQTAELTATDGATNDQLGVRSLQQMTRSSSARPSIRSDRTRARARSMYSQNTARNGPTRARPPS